MPISIKVIIRKCLIVWELIDIWLIMQAGVDESHHGGAAYIDSYADVDVKGMQYNGNHNFEKDGMSSRVRHAQRSSEHSRARCTVLSTHIQKSGCTDILCINRVDMQVA